MDQFLPPSTQSETCPHHPSVCLTGDPVLAVKPTRTSRNTSVLPCPKVRGAQPGRLSQLLQPRRILSRQWPDARSLPRRFQSLSNGSRKATRRKGKRKGRAVRGGRGALPQTEVGRAGQPAVQRRWGLLGDGGELPGWALTTVTPAISSVWRQRDG